MMVCDGMRWYMISSAKSMGPNLVYDGIWEWYMGMVYGNGIWEWYMGMVYG